MGPSWPHIPPHPCACLTMLSLATIISSGKLVHAQFLLIPGLTTASLISLKLGSYLALQEVPGPFVWETIHVTILLFSCTAWGWGSAYL